MSWVRVTFINTLALPAMWLQGHLELHNLTLWLPTVFNLMGWKIYSCTQHVCVEQLGIFWIASYIRSLLCFLLFFLSLSKRLFYCTVYISGVFFPHSSVHTSYVFLYWNAGYTIIKYHIIFLWVQNQLCVWRGLVSSVASKLLLARLQKIYELLTAQYIKPLPPANLQGCCRCQQECEVSSSWSMAPLWT